MSRPEIIVALMKLNAYNTAVEVGAGVGVTAAHVLAECDLDMYLMIEYDMIRDRDPDLYTVFRDSDEVDEHRRTLKPAALIRASSKLVASFIVDRSIDLVFIDANHDYDSVHNDIEYWLPKISDDGIICGHDYDLTGNWNGLIQAVYQLIGEVHLVEERDGGNNHVWWQYASVVRANRALALS